MARAKLGYRQAAKLAAQEESERKNPALRVTADDQDSSCLRLRLDTFDERLCRQGIFAYSEQFQTRQHWAKRLCKL